MDDASRFIPLARGASFPLANRLERVIWGLCWLLLARFTPPALHRWRRLLLRLFGARVGAGTRVHGSAIIWLPRNLVIGKGALIGPGARLYNQGRIDIGDHCVVSQRAHICASTHRANDPGFALELRPAQIGEGCWIAAEAFVGPGVTMGAGSVLGARAALFEDSAAMAIYRGNPAQRIGQRDWSEPR